MKNIERLTTFLEESNKIEGVYDLEALYETGEAWQYAVDERKNFGIDYICGIHEKLMSKLNPQIAGKLRRKTVYITGRKEGGQQVVIQTLPAKGNKPRLRKWCGRYKAPESAEEIKVAHIDFEMIHPFIDGNGRVGRILYNVQRLQLRLPVEIFYEKNKQEYYEWFAKRQRDEDLIKMIKESENFRFGK